MTLYNLYENSESVGAKDEEGILKYVVLNYEMVKDNSTKLNKMIFENHPSLKLTQDDEIHFYDIYENLVFKGFVRTYKNDIMPQRITIYDKSIILKDTRKEKVYRNKTPDEIIEDLINNYTDFIFKSSVVETLTLTTYVSVGKSIFECIKELSEAMGYVFYVNINDEFILEYPNKEENGIELIYGTNCDTEKGIQYLTNLLCNKITIKGKKMYQEKESYLSGDGTTQVFQIGNSLTELSVFYPTENELLNLDYAGNDGEYYVNEPTGELIFKNAPASGSNNILLNYKVVARPTFTLTSGEILNPENLHQKELEVNYLETENECENYAKKYLEKYSEPIKVIELLVYYENIKFSDFEPFQKIKYIDELREINEFLTILEVRKSKTADGLAIRLTIGTSKSFRYNENLEQELRLKDLENQGQISPLKENFQVEDKFKVKITSSVSMEIRARDTNQLIFDTDSWDDDTKYFDNFNDWESI